MSNFEFPSSAELHQELDELATSTATQIVDFCTNLVDVGKDTARASSAYRLGEFSDATFYIAGEDSEDGKFSKLFTRVPKEEFADSYGWRAEILVGRQDPILSRHLLVNKDGTIRESNGAGTNEFTLNNEQTEGMWRYLQEIEPALIPDLVIAPPGD